MSGKEMGADSWGWRRGRRRVRPRGASAGGQGWAGRVAQGREAQDATGWPFLAKPAADGAPAGASANVLDQIRSSHPSLIPNI